MGGPETKVPVAPGSQVVQTSQTAFPVPPQKKRLDAQAAGRQLAPPGAPSGPPPGGAAQTYPIGGPAPFPSFMAGQGPRPNIVHDHGFLDSDDGNHTLDLKKLRAPTAEDRAKQAKWILLLQAAETARPELHEGTECYRHFHFGNGNPRTFNYDRYVYDDTSGWQTLRAAIEDVISAAVQINDARIGPPPPDGVAEPFDLTSDVIGCGGDSDRCPYPDTENWQKALGGHFIWLQASVGVTFDQGSQTRTFAVTMTLNAEDMYNFNPGAEDIATGTPDNENGIFEQTGLGHEFFHTSRLQRSFSFKAPIQPTLERHYKAQDLNIPKVIDPGFRSSPYETLDDLVKRHNGKAPSP